MLLQWRSTQVVEGRFAPVANYKFAPALAKNLPLATFLNASRPCFGTLAESPHKL